MWINEVDSSRHMDELKSSGFIFGREFPDFEVLDSESASALKKLVTADLKERVYMEEQKAQQDKRFLMGRQIAFMI